jgi:hypothetical protein
MNLQESIRRILREDKKTKSTNKEFSKYKDSKFNSLRDYTLQDIVNNWESLSDHKNENIKTIRHFIDNPDKIVDLVYDEKGLEDGYHRLIAAKILKKPRFSYRLVENLQENIRRILREYDSDKMIGLVGEYMNFMHPRFNKKEVTTEEYEDTRGYPVIYFSDDYIWLATYHYGTKELQLSTALFNELEGLFNDEMEYVIDWFNNEFGKNAEYVTY